MGVSAVIGECSKALGCNCWDTCYSDSPLFQLVSLAPVMGISAMTGRAQHGSRLIAVGDTG